MYKFLFKHVLSKFNPEFDHHLAMNVIRVAGWPGIRSVVAPFFRPGSDASVEAMGITFPSAFGVAAGFDKDAVGVRGLSSLGFGHIEVGTLTNLAQPGNPKPRLFRLIPDLAVINRMGFNNHGAAAAAQRLAKLRKRRPNAVIGVNIGKSRAVEVEHALADYAASARAVAPYADYLAINVSSPNTPGLRTLQATESLQPILRSVKAIAGGVPVAVKIAPDLADEEIAEIAKLAVDEGLAAIIATNTTISREGLTSPQQRIEEIGAGGLSGVPLKPRALEVVRLVRANVPADMCVIGNGGITNADDVREFLDAGANLVQGYTAFIYEGPFWARKINRGLAKSA